MVAADEGGAVDGQTISPARLRYEGERRAKEVFFDLVRGQLI